MPHSDLLPGPFNNGNSLLAIFLRTLPGILVCLLCSCRQTETPVSPAEPVMPIRFAAIGDFGWAGAPEEKVADMVKGWDPDFIITLGDNNYMDGADSTIDRNVGQYYHSYIHPYAGSYGAGSTQNRFFPCLGNHDWLTPGAVPYLKYFKLPGNGRYYDFVRGPVHFFVLSSDIYEPDGRTPTSKQGRWLHAVLPRATERWKIVYFHHPPYTSGSTPEPNPKLAWPFREWGASAVLCGHEHDYERLIEDSLVYFINGIGGRSLIPFGTAIDSGSRVRYVGNYGAMLIEAGLDSVRFRCFNIADSLVDSYTLR
jgi:tartrate-resistant acid phosphatase type 5